MNRREFLATAHLVAFSLALIAFGFLGGRFVTALHRSAPLSVLASEEDRDARPARRLPVVTVEGIEGGQLHGRVRGAVRLFVGDEAVAIREDGTFAAPAGPLLMNVEHVLIPPWAAFVASRRGRKYYDVTSAAAARLVPENRIYFRSSEEAEAAGYVR